MTSEIRSLMEDKLFTIRVNRMCEIIEEIFEEYVGEPETKPIIECPLCLKQTNGYFCDWGNDKHIKFYCEHCGLTAR